MIFGDIVPSKGVGDNIILGMTRESLQDLFKEKPNTVKREFENEDHFSTTGIIGSFNEGSNIYQAFTFIKPSSPNFKGEILLGKPFIELKNWFKQIDNTVEIDGDGLTSYKFGIGLYASYAEEAPKDPVEAVIVFEKGYYDIS